MMFSEEFVERKLFGIAVPSSSLIAINPLVGVLAGFYLSRKNNFLEGCRSLLKLILAFGFLAGAFLLLYIGSSSGKDKVCIFFLWQAFAA